MILRQRYEYISRNDMTLTAANFAAQTVKVAIDRTWPIEAITVVVHMTLGALIPASQVTYGLLNILKRATLTVNDGVQPRAVIDVTGPGALIWAVNAGLNLDRSTMGLVFANRVNSATILPAGSVLRATYRIPIVHPQITGKLRPRMLLPVHIHPQDPILQLDFAAAAEMSGEANPFSAVLCEVILERREMPVGVTQDIQATGGFIPFDLVEQINVQAASQTGVPLRIPLNQPGSYTGLAIHHLKGSAVLACGDISASTTVGTETQWSLEMGRVTYRTWRMKHVQQLNDCSRVAPLPAISDWSAAAYAQNNCFAPNFGAGLATGKMVQEPSVIYLDFLSDGVVDADELGSVLDTNLPANSGVKVELVGTITTPANQASQINLVGHRLYGDLSRWQVLRAA